MTEMLIVAASAGSTIVERIGSYAGLSAIVGLGVLALLYFAQAREVKRLREWAGRAPERAAELEQRVQVDAQKRVVAQPLAPATTAAQQAEAARTAAAAALYAKVPPPPPPPPPLVPPRAPLAQQTPAPAAPEAVAGTAAQSVPAAPPSPAGVPAVASGASAASPTTPPASTPPATPAPATVVPAASAITTTPPATAAGAARQAQPSRAASMPVLGNGAIGQDTHESDAARPEPMREDEPFAPDSGGRVSDGGFSIRRVAAIVSGAVAAIVAGVVLMVVLTSSDDTPPKPNDFGTVAPQSSPLDSPARAPGTSANAPVNRGATNVAVLNGTTQTGLARAVADKVEGAGFKIGSVGNNVDQQVSKTVVSYTDGNERAARTVAQSIGIARATVKAADANTSVAAEADVVVTVGTDQTE